VEHVKGETAAEPDALRSAMRRARVEQAERAGVTAELRGAEIVRLDMLFEAFKPILAQVPAEIDMFDAGLTPGERPRLFVDMIAFVEMAHDRRVYRFVQDTRHGRVTLAENERIEAMVEAMTDYVARRLVERQLALAADASRPQDARAAQTPAAPSSAEKDAAEKASEEKASEEKAAEEKASAAAAPVAAPLRRARGAGFFTLLLFVIELLGSVVLFILLTGAANLAWRAGEAWWVSRLDKIL